MEKIKYENRIFYVYKHDGKVAKICHGVKDHKEKYIKKMAKFLSKTVNEDCFIIPIPQHSGKAEYTLETALKIKEMKKRKFNIEILDVLECDPHISLYDQKKAIKEKGKFLTKEQIKNLDIGNLRLKKDFDKNTIEGKSVFFLDNVMTTGTTFKNCLSLIPDAKPLIFAISSFYFRNN